MFYNHKTASKCFTHFNRVQYKYDNQHVANVIFHQHHCSFCMKEIQRKYDYPFCQCLRIKNSQIQSKIIIQSLNRQNSVFKSNYHQPNKYCRDLLLIVKKLGSINGMGNGQSVVTPIMYLKITKINTLL